MIALLSGKSLAVEDTLRPETLNLQLNLDTGSTGSMTLGPDAPQITPGAWVSVDTPQGKREIMRVKSMDTAAETGTVTAQLEHVINCLKDDIAFGEIKPETISSKAKTVTPAAAVRYLLGKQTTEVWTLGGCEYEQSYAYTFTSPTIHAALMTVCSALEDYYLDWDTDRMPFRLYIRKRTDTVGAEMRASRNLSTMRVSVDRSQMYTRIYPVGENNLKIDSENDGKSYLQENTAKYGVISKTVTDATKGSAALLKAWARAMLKRHSSPIVTVTISGLELSEATGEDLDRLDLGTICRAPVEGYGTIEERITRIQWQDIIHQPERVTVTLANNLQDVAQILRQRESASAAGAAKKAQKDGEDHAWFVDTDTHVGMVAEAVAGRGSDGKPNWSRVSQLMADGTGLHGKVTTVENEVTTHETRIDALEDGLFIEVRDRTQKEGEIVGQLNITAQHLQSVQGRVTQIEGDITEIEGSMIWQDKDRIASVVGRMRVDPETGKLIIAEGGGVVVERNQVQMGLYKEGDLTAGFLVQQINGETTAVIKADRVNIEGKVTAAYLNSKISTIQTLNTVAISASGNVSTTSGVIGYLYHRTDNGNVSVGLAMKNFSSVTYSGDNVTLNFLKLDGTAGAVTFSRPTSGSGAWSNGIYTVKSAGGTTIASTRISNIARTTAVTPGRNYLSASFKVQYYVGAQNRDTGFTQSLSIPCGDVYDNGWKAAADKVAAPASAPSGEEKLTFDVTVPHRTSVGSTSAMTFTLQAGTPASSGFASVAYDNRTVGRIQIGGWYDAGRSYARQNTSAGTFNYRPFQSGTPTGTRVFANVTQLSSGTAGYYTFVVDADGTSKYYWFQIG